jgi:hypothetical protein
MGKLIGYPKDSKTQKGLVFITDNSADTTDLTNVTFDIPTATVAAAVRASPYDNIPYLGFEFRFININPATDGQSFGWQLNPVGGSGFYDTYPLYRSGFYQVAICNNAADDTYGMWSGGYVLDTERFDEIDFKMSSGNFDGIIRMYGIL